MGSHFLECDSVVLSTPVVECRGNGLKEIFVRVELVFIRAEELLLDLEKAAEAVGVDGDMGGVREEFLEANKNARKLRSVDSIGESLPHGVNVISHSAGGSVGRGPADPLVFLLRTATVSVNHLLTFVGAEHRGGDWCASPRGVWGGLGR